MAPPCRLILNFCWCHLILSFSLLALEGERGERRLKTWRQAVSVHHPPAACPLVFHLLLLGVAIIGPVMRLPKEEETRRSPMITASRLTTSRGSSGQRTEGSSGWILVSRESEDRNIESWILMITSSSSPSRARGRKRGEDHWSHVTRRQSWGWRDLPSSNKWVVLRYEDLVSRVNSCSTFHAGADGQ